MNDMDIPPHDASFELGSDFLKNVAPKVTLHTSPLLKVDFAPWHKPRKQWIRDKQWGDKILGLMKKLNLRESGRPLNYLSLPGVDLLDIRSLEDVFVQEGVKLKFLGLNHIDASESDVLAEQALSLNEVRALDFVDQSSLVITERFEDLSDPVSIASRRVLEEHKTFDVVNIDLCASFAKYKPGTLNSLYTAIHKLLAHQSNYRTEDWVFLITTRTDKAKVDSDAFSALVRSALEELDPGLISDYLEKEIGVDRAQFEGQQYSQDCLSSLQHRNCFTSSFGIWKLRLLIMNAPYSKSMMSVPYGYHVESKDQVTDMISMSFWCSRLPYTAIDPAGLSSVRLNEHKPDHNSVFQSCAKRSFESSIGCIDLDAYLLENNVEYAECFERSKTLLKKARYSLDKYDDWVQLQQEKIIEMVTTTRV